MRIVNQLPKVILQGYIIVPEADLAVVTNELVTHTKLTREELGCLTFTATPDADNPNQFNVYEEFANQAAFDAHKLRVQHSKWGEVTKHIERHYQITSA